jgi:4-hydroxybenzoate polyprenyltransferase/phosphoserine phosphatase
MAPAAAPRDVNVSDSGIPLAPDSKVVPLCVDLDGTILRGDTFWEQVFLLIRRNPFFVFQLLAWTPRGKSYVKERLAARPMPEWSSFNVDNQLVAWLRGERSRGRPVHLVTGTHHAAAKLAAENLGCFDAVHSTTATENLTSTRKAALLREMHGVGGFDYVGNSSADLPVWQEAATAVACHARPSTIARLRARHRQVEVRDPLPSTLAAILRQLRPHQWVKNLLVFLPLILAHRLDDAAAWRASTLAFIAFCCVASSAYCLNDLFDLAHDRGHPQKRRRPLASGDLAPLTVVLLALALPVVALAVALFLPMTFLIALALYGVGTLLYSIAIKRFAGTDVILLTALYTLRIVAGGLAAQIYVSQWLLAFSTFFFLSLSLLKRHGEILLVAGADADCIPGRGYRSSSLPIVRVLGKISAVLAALVLILYVNGEAVTRLYRSPALLWLLGPFVLLWFYRMWKLSAQGKIPDDPIPFVFRDPASYVVALLTGILLVIATRLTL